MLALANTKKQEQTNLKKPLSFLGPPSSTVAFLLLYLSTPLQTIHPAGHFTAISQAPCCLAPITMLPCAISNASWAMPPCAMLHAALCHKPCVTSHASRAMPPYAMPPCAMLHAAPSSHFMPLSTYSFIQTQSLPKRLIPTVIAKQLSKSISLGWLLLLRGWYCLFACHYMSFC